MLRYMKKRRPLFPKQVALTDEPRPRRTVSQGSGEWLMGQRRMEINPPYRKPKAEPPKADT